MIYAFLQMLSFVVGHALVKYNFAFYHPLHVVLLIIVFGLLILSIYILVRPSVLDKIKALRLHLKAIWIYLFLSFLNGASFYIAIYTIGLSGFAILSNLTPVMLVISGLIFFAERPDRAQYALMAMTIFATFLFSLSGNEFDTDLIGILAGIVTCGSWAAMNVVVKRFSHHVGGFELNILRLPFIGLCFWLIFMAGYGLGLVPPMPLYMSYQSMALFLATALFLSVIPYVLFPIALRHTDITVVGIIKAIQPVLSFIVGIVIFSEPLDSLKLTAAIIAISSGILYSGRNYYSRKPAIPPK